MFFCGMPIADVGPGGRNHQSDPDLRVGGRYRQSQQSSRKCDSGEHALPPLVVPLQGLRAHLAPPYSVQPGVPHGDDDASQTLFHHAGPAERPKMMDDLLLARIEERHIHFLAPPRHADGRPPRGQSPAEIRPRPRRPGRTRARRAARLHPRRRRGHDDADRRSLADRDRARRRNRRRAVRRLGLEHGRQRGAEFAAEAVLAGDRGRAKSC